MLVSKRGEMFVGAHLISSALSGERANDLRERIDRDRSNVFFIIIPLSWLELNIGVVFDLIELDMVER
jgi:hypothetical protein